MQTNKRYAGPNDFVAIEEIRENVFKSNMQTKTHNAA